MIELKNRMPSISLETIIIARRLNRNLGIHFMGGALFLVSHHATVRLPGKQEKS